MHFIHRTVPVLLHNEDVAALSQEVHRVREVLEAVLAPGVATSVMFAALQRHGGNVPHSTDEIVSLVRGPMREVLDERVDADARDELISRLERVLAGEAAAADFSIDIDVDDEMVEGEPSVTATMPIVWKEPVSVVVMAAGQTFESRLEASLGAARVRITRVLNVPQLRHATFSKEPLLVFVDASDPVDVEPLELAGALNDLPGNVVPVLWGADLQLGVQLDPALASVGANPVRIQLADGFEPLLDLILSRYKGDSVPPRSDTEPPAF